MRIIAGALKGRRLGEPGWQGLRPTSDKLRETLFNVLGPRVADARVLDGYAGTGAVGIEALSRGARHVTFVERDPRAIRLIERNLQQCAVSDRYAIIRGEFADAVAGLSPGAFDIVFVDPPYGSRDLISALDSATTLASTETLVVIEHARRDAPPPRAGNLVLTRELVSGDSGLAFYRQA